MGSKLRRLRVQAGVTTKRYQRVHGHPAARGVVSVVGRVSGRMGVEIAVTGSGELTPETKAELQTAFADAVGVGSEALPPAPSANPKHRRSPALLATVATLAMLADLPGRGSR